MSTSKQQSKKTVAEDLEIEPSVEKKRLYVKYSG